MEFITILSGMSLAIVSLLFAMHLHSNHKGTLTNWPIMGMLPSLLVNLHCFHDWSTRVLARNGGTFVFIGPWFTNMKMVWTCDPANVRYFSVTNFSNFPKGPEFKEMFDILGDGIFNSDSEAWLSQRRTSQALINHSRFLLFLKTSSWDMLGNRLIPFLDNVIDNDMTVDLQDVFFRFAFDMTSSWTTGTELGCLSIELPKVPIVAAIDGAFKAILRRHYMPKMFWKLQRWLGIGSEEDIRKSRIVVDDFISQCISKKREQLSKINKDQNGGIDLLGIHMEEDENKSDKYLRDFIFTYLIAGNDSISIVLTWFFWHLSKNPSIETKIIQELKHNPPLKGRKFSIDEGGPLVYLHAALCESLRLYPPVWIEHKSSIDTDILPSGHKVESKGRVMIFSYAMARIEGIWGGDCLEFKPERWINSNSKRAKIKYQPSYKFPAFHSGPRTCLGKDIAFVLMKMVAGTLLYNYHFEVLEDQLVKHRVCPRLSLGLYKENGLIVKIKRRELI